jgi:hypothetical protein
MEELALLKDTIAFWEHFAGRQLTQEDARQVLENTRGFFATLERWATESPGARSRGKEAA